MTYSHATNTILYGPPGTGKTYLTATRAVELCDGHAPPHRGDLLKRYEELRREERVRFVTFHQSYGYEDFVEGLRPVLVDGKVAYRVEPGVFRKACDAAKRTQTVKPGLQGKPLRDRGVYKMSLGARRDEGGVKVFQECLEKECVLLGWGEDVDFSGCKDEGAIRERLKEVKPEIDRLDSQVQFVNIFMHELKTGDIVIVSDGNRLFRAIAEVTGDYAFLEDGTFHQMRPVKWLAVLENPPSVREVFDRDFVQRSLYKLAREGLNFTRLEELLRAVETEPVVKPYVLIIDEINRANISKVFGELITLLEPDKREGASNAITVKLPYSGDDFSVPSNLHIIATMNTADRSIALLDTALRRRFDFDEVLPNPSLLNGKHVDGVDLSALLTALNERIEALFDRDHTIGHAYLLGVDSLQKLDVAFRRKLLPLLQEYFYENWERIRNVLNDKDGAFVTAVDRTATVGDGLENSSSETRRVYAVNKVAFVASAFKRIYEG